MASMLSDRIIRLHKRQGKEWFLEDRLRATILGALFLVPVSILACGLITRYVGGTLGLVLSCICLFTNDLVVRDVVLILVLRNLRSNLSGGFCLKPFVCLCRRHSAPWER